MIGYARALFPALLLGILPLSARAEECGKLKLVASLDLPDSDSHRVIVPITLNGKPFKFIFDTGGVYSQISPNLVKELNLTPVPDNITLQDVNGRTSKTAVTIDDFGFGPIKAKDVTFHVATMNDFEGLLTPTRFQNVDVDIDFGQRHMNLFLSDHCPGKVFYWKFDKVAVVPVSMRNAHFNLPVTVDGHPMRAIIDTGATDTIMNSDTAYRLYGLKKGSPDMVPDGFINGDKDTPAYRHKFSSLSFEGITIQNPTMLVARDRGGLPERENHLQTGSFINHESDDLVTQDITVGMDVLSKLHVYFATKENKLYITKAGAPDEPPPFAPAK